MLLTTTLLCAGAAAPRQTEKVEGTKEWKMDDLLPAMADLGAGHDWNQGRELFKKAACGVCHAFGSESEGTGLAPKVRNAALATVTEAEKADKELAEILAVYKAPPAGRGR